MIKEIDPKYLVYEIQGDEISGDEPLLLFRARNKFALDILRIYKRMCIEGGCPLEHIEKIDNWIEAFQNFAIEHAENMRRE
jgi:hypothetical protein